MRKIAKVAGQTFDENGACREWQSKGVNLGEKMSTLFVRKTESRNRRASDDDSADTVVDPERVVPKTVPNAIP